MSRPSALPSPLAVATRPAPTAPPAGPLSTLHAPPLAASAASATPPEERMISGSGTPARSQRSVSLPEVAGEQRREVGVEHRRGAPLVLPELRQHLGGDRDVQVREGGAKGGGEPVLVGGLQVGVKKADRDRLRLEPLDLVDDPGDLVLRQGLDDPGRVDALADPDPRVGRSERRRPVVAEPVERRPVLAGDLEQVGEAARSRSATSARRAARAARWCRPSSRGRSARRRPGRRPRARARPRSPRSPRATDRRGSSATWPCGSDRRRRGRRR